MVVLSYLSNSKANQVHKSAAILKTVSLGACSFAQSSNNSDDAVFETFLESTAENCLFVWIFSFSVTE